MREIEARLKEASERINQRNYPDYSGGFKRGMLIGLTAALMILLFGLFVSSFLNAVVPWEEWPWAVGVAAVSGAIAGATRAFRPPSAPSKD